ncbi:TetR family transcriptional regulator [Frankia sp. R82]|uniref:TetR/AcrR family transcriptional regulator n=1 Tax=Frankia sp. R82 TaxID=2950553 RepID=UPI0020447078|nr:TetR family transcriptional regulator [Frankia sp. R82]MCM3882687.1 TetR family transcriptional regulator [Frankia sp. R82]
MTTRPLAEAKRQAALEHVLTAARRYVIENSVDATMDQLAEASGVSRRTLFRLFGTREKLIASAFQAAMAHYLRSLPPFRGDIDQWLRATCEAAHRMNASIGPGYWEMAARTDLPADLAALQLSTRRDWNDRITEITVTLWHEHGHRGSPPGVLLTAVGAHLSSHFTAAVIIDAGRDWQTASALAHAAITGTVRFLAAPGQVAQLDGPAVAEQVSGGARAHE